ncbi:MAG: NADH-quinone oxidoreductase subunit N [Halobacteriovoraceae bacterium]|jgi:NADH-quinone oxidoreductase subunit N|nr:NADH-quinone oxidoreductase subunit N [Halobacteriovoraceae bacterium]
MIMAPEIAISGTAFLILLNDVFTKNKMTNYILAILGLAIAFTFACGFSSTQASMFGGRFIIDSAAMGFKFIFITTAFAAIVFANYQSTKTQFKYLGEFYTLLLFSLTGMMFLVSSTDLITLVISLELSTLPLFLLSAWQKHKMESMEAAVKYVLLGAFSSAILLFGVALLYGLTGSMELQTISAELPRMPLYFSLAMIFAGIGFKITTFPFHQWSPDVYENAPTSITSFLSIASKAAGVAFFIKIFFDMMGSFHQDFQTLYLIAAVVTMSFGNLVAIGQKNIKRFMAYSSIAHAGFIFMGLLINSPESKSAIIYFFIAYLVSNLTIFGVISFVETETGKTQIKDYAGLSQKRPLYALAMLIALFSLAGIPPLSGFLGKFYLMNIAAKAGFYWLVGVAAINSTISLYYYLQIIRQMYVVDGEENFSGKTPLLFNLVVIALTLGTVLLGIFPIKF